MVFFPVNMNEVLAFFSQQIIQYLSFSLYIYINICAKYGVSASINFFLFRFICREFTQSINMM